MPASHSALFSQVAISIEVDAAQKGKKDKEPKAVKKLRELADELEKNMLMGPSLPRYQFC